jgi:hypothetical protein
VNERRLTGRRFTVAELTLKAEATGALEGATTRLSFISMTASPGSIEGSHPSVIPGVPFPPSVVGRLRNASDHLTVLPFNVIER